MLYLVLQILHADTIQVCGTNDTGFVCDGSKSTFRVLFKVPVEIQANTSYIACATLKVIGPYRNTPVMASSNHIIGPQECTWVFTNEHFDQVW